MREGRKEKTELERDSIHAQKSPCDNGMIGSETTRYRKERT